MTAKLTAGALALLLVGGCSGQADNQASAQAADSHAASATIKAPASIAEEHHELHEVLAAATREPGTLGAAATKLEAVLGPHFAREEQIATPPLGLLGPLAHGPATAEMREVLPMTEALEAELPKMMEEHGAIKTATAELRAAAAAAGRDDLVRFADHLAAHAGQEEQILYPAAILVGRYVKATAPK
jgi:hypothetical protein